MTYPLSDFRDVDLVVVFSDLLDRAMKAKGINDLPIVQLQQPTQQARGDSGVYFSFLFDDHVGWMTSDMEYDPAAENFKFTEAQHMIGRIQISVLYPWNPDLDDPAIKLTAKDVANYLAMKMKSMNYIRFFRAAGLGILRVANVRPNPFENDRGQYEFMPSFDMELTYNREIGQVVPRIVELIGEIERV
ncbi:phage gateway protein [Citrobacter sp.]|uniref:phage gateway protein n=1 Tax=Citrobacter sp. TaxID=1896336 RepID=UPI002FCBFBC0